MNIGTTNDQQYGLEILSCDGGFIFGNITYGNQTAGLNSSGNTSLMLFGNSFNFTSDVAFTGRTATFDKSVVVGTNTSGSTNENLVVHSPFGGIGAGLILNNPTASVSGRGSQVQFNNAGTEIANIRASGDGSASADGRIIWQTALSSSVTERMRLDKNGSLFLNGADNFAADAQADDDYEIDIPNISALVAGLRVAFTATTANTGGATLEITSVGDLDAILKMNDQALVTGDIEAGQIVEVRFDGANWQMTSQLAQ